MSTNSSKHTVAIIGGGLAGLYAAYQLSLKQIDFILLEAKPLLGGRILGLLNTQVGDEQLGDNKSRVQGNSQQSDYFNDLGPTWIFEHQVKMQALVAQLGLTLFEQYTQGDALYQLANANAPRRIEGAGTMRMFRVEGGTLKVIEALASKLTSQSILVDTAVTKLTKNGDGWTVLTSNNEAEVINADHVLLAIPPRIAARDLFASTEQHAPTIVSAGLLNALNNTQTWMAAQAKFVVTYTKPFWRSQGLSGQSFSQVGPMVEMHDASCANNNGYALFGFIGVPAVQRSTISKEALQQACLKQLAFFYGDVVYSFDSAEVKDWSTDIRVCTERDVQEGSKHPAFNLAPFKNETAALNLDFIGSEYAAVDPGYLEGALDVVDKCIARFTSVPK